MREEEGRGRGGLNAMPTTLEWKFEGGDEGSQLAARRGMQRVYFGDTVIDEITGQQGKALRLEG